MKIFQFPDSTWHVAAMSVLFLLLGLGKKWYQFGRVHKHKSQETSSPCRWPFPKNWKIERTVCSSIALPGTNESTAWIFQSDLLLSRLDKYFWPHRKRRDSDRQVNSNIWTSTNFGIFKTSPSLSHLNLTVERKLVNWLSISSYFHWNILQRYRLSSDNLPFAKLE